MKTLTLTDQSASNLLRHAQGFDALASGTASEIIAQLATPATPPVAGDWKAQATAAAKAAGFDKAILIDWDWAAGGKTIDTANIGGIGVNGILIARCVATGPVDSVLASISATGYPAPSMDAGLRLCVSSQPVGVDPSPATVYSPSPTLRYCVGPAPLVFGKPSAASLVPGQAYYIHVAGRDKFDQRTAQPGMMHYPATDIRLSLRKPSGH